MLKENHPDTIAAIATAPGSGGIGIIRVSGERSFELCGNLFSGKRSFENIPSHYASYGCFITPLGEVLDECLMIKMKGPNSFTREDVVEFHCHGGRVVLSQIMDSLTGLGVRVAEPGEFTKRAFLNGRIDLSQAEAVIDIINAQTKESSKAALKQLDGRLSDKVAEAKNILITLIAHIETNVDYPEYDLEELSDDNMIKALNRSKTYIDNLVNGFKKGRILREGIQLAIVGRPNVGKSSFLNSLVGKNRAIVTDIPGTTRDIIEEVIDIGGFPVRLIDTAGIRETNDPVEKIGVNMTVNAVRDADMVVFMIDSSEGLTAEDINIYHQIDEKQKVILINKIDKGERFDLPFDEKAIYMSMTKDIGLEEFIEYMKETFAQGVTSDVNEVLVTNARHQHLLEQSKDAIKMAIASIENGMPVDCSSIDIMKAVQCLGEITGDNVSEDILDEIFSKFCLGK